MRQIVNLTIVSLLIISSYCYAEMITTATLLEEMIDLERLTDLSTADYKTVQYSSYDRRSDTPNAQSWKDNSDGFGGEPIPGFEAVLKEPDESGIGEYLVCDLEGPGALVRLWAADNAVKGDVKMYLDGKLVYDGSGITFFRKLTDFFAEQSGIDKSLFDGAFQQRDTVYFPIPFAKSCKVIYTGNIKNQHFYHLQARLYKNDQKVRTFDLRDLRDNAGLIKSVSDVLKNPSVNFKINSQKKHTFDFSVSPKEKRLLIHLTKPGAIQELTLKLNAADITKALRSMVLYIQFDNYNMPQVQAPVGDFFGAAPGIVPYNSLPFTVEKDGTMTCRFVMPYKDNARIFVHNLDDQKVMVSGQAQTADYTWTDDSLHFYARWRVDHDIISMDPGIADLPFLIARGKGRYVGTSATIMNPTPIPTMGGGWWGEGDEKVFVDNDALPSIFGTGSEDYFNYSWCSNNLFFYSYAVQPRVDGPGNRGFTSNIRYHILDDIPFMQNIFFYIELWQHRRTEGLSYARLPYCYGKNLLDDHVFITSEDVRKPQLPESWSPAADGDAQNCTFFQAEDILTSGNNTEVTKDGLWAEGKLLSWKPKKQDEQIELTFNVDAPAEYRLYLTMQMSSDSGIYTAEIDGEKLYLHGHELRHLRTDFLTQSRTVYSQNLKLQPGNHTIRFNNKSTKPGRVIGIDFIWLKKIRPIPHKGQGFMSMNEGEEMKVIEKSEPPIGTQIQGQGGFKGQWSNQAQLWMQFTEPDQWIDLEMNCGKPGMYHLSANITTAGDYGTMAIYANGQLLKDNICCYNQEVNQKLVDLGKADLRAGQNVFRIEVVGKNPKSSGYFLGLDYIKLSGAEVVGGFFKIYDPSVGEKENWYINDHCFIQAKDGKWHMFGITHAEPANPLDEDNLAHATADKLIQQPWKKEPFALTVDESTGETHLWAPHVIYHEGLYYMFYCGGGQKHSEYQMNLATSTDLYNWKRHEANPLFIDGFDARDPFVMPHDGKWLMYYTATSKPEGGNYIVACVESNDLLKWENRRTVFKSIHKGTIGGPTESPTVIKRGDWYYLFIGPRGGYDGTDVFRSKDPFNWQIQDKVGHIEAHAAEIIQDSQGRWYVSRCGWGKGGLYLSPLYWNDQLSECK